MNSSYTLVSFIGAGNYQKANFVFDNPHEEVSAWTAPSALAMAKNQHWTLSKIVIIGTYTSKWGYLAMEVDPELADRLDEASMLDFDDDENLTRLNDLLDELVRKLSDMWNVTVLPVIHYPGLTDETVPEISEVYDSLSEEIKEEDNLLIDITHAFRHMPVLLFQMMQQHLHEFYDKNVEVIYGEFEGGNKETTYFRDLNKYWDIAKRTDSLHRFNASFDGDNLGQYMINAGYVEAGRWVQEFSWLIKNAHILKILPLLERLDSAITSISEDESVPAFVKNARKILVEIRQAFGQTKKAHKKCLIFAELLDSRNLATQTYIAIDEAIEVRMAELAASVRCEPEDTYIGKLEFWNKNCRLVKVDNRYYPYEEYPGMEVDGAKFFLGDAILYGQVKREYLGFMKIRNTIAHGAWQDLDSPITKIEIRGSDFDYLKMARQICKILDGCEHRSQRG